MALTGAEMATVFFQTPEQEHLNECCIKLINID